MKDSKTETPKTTEAIARVRSFLQRQNPPPREKPRRDAMLTAGPLSPVSPSATQPTPPFFSLTQHYLQAYFGPTTETLEALPPGMFLEC
ncbi:hypothetical protein JW916_10480 [Candidatus Sumerlaeota bacterium]|nr:hypothetical protein [Candidatus Sumerlaeota bacterium]